MMIEPSTMLVPRMSMLPATTTPISVLGAWRRVGERAHFDVRLRADDRRGLVDLVVEQRRRR